MKVRTLKISESRIDFNIYTGSVDFYLPGGAGRTVDLEDIGNIIFRPGESIKDIGHFIFDIDDQRLLIPTTYPYNFLADETLNRIDKIMSEMYQFRFSGSLYLD